MLFSIDLSPRASEDIDKAFHYYNSKTYGLGYEFINVLDSFFRKISSVPTASAIRYEIVRVKPMKVFPFTIHYIVDEENKQVLILRIFNTWQQF